MRVLLDAIDAYDRDAPVVIGGDLNAFSLGLADLGDPERVAAALRDDPLRWSNPVPHEPLFALAAERGYAWSRCNAPGESTLRHASEAGSSRGKLKLDWFLCRGVEASAPRVVAASVPRPAGCSPTTKPSCSRWGVDRRRTRLPQPVCYGVAFESAARASSGMRAMRMSLRSNMPNSHGQSRSMRLV